MVPRPFYTKSNHLAGLRQLVQVHLDRRFQFDDLKALFQAVDAHCANHFPPEERGGWFSPRVVGGAQIKHTPPHIVFSVLAIYMHLANGDLDPVPYLSTPLAMGGAMAITLDPSHGYLVVDRFNQARPMTDLLLILPAQTPRTYIEDTYGLPPLRPEVVVVGWHSAAQPFDLAVSSGQLLLHPGTRRVVNPMAPSATPDSDLFFEEPINRVRLARHRDRLVEVFSTPSEALKRNLESAAAVLRTYLAQEARPTP